MLSATRLTTTEVAAYFDKHEQLFTGLANSENKNNFGVQWPQSNFQGHPTCSSVLTEKCCCTRSGDI